MPMATRRRPRTSSRRKCWTGRTGSPGASAIAIDQNLEQLRLSGQLSNLAIATGLISSTGSVGFSLAHELVDVNLTGALGTDQSVVDLQNANLFTLGLNLSSGSLQVGTAGFGASVTGGQVALALITPATPTAPITDSRYWLAVQGTNL